MSRLFYFLIFISLLSPFLCDDCKSVKKKLLEQMSQLSTIGVMEELLWLVVHWRGYNISVYQVPVSQVHSREVMLTNVSGIRLEDKWKFLYNFPQLDNLKKQIFTKAGLAAIRGGPTLMYVSGYDESGVMCSATECPTAQDLHNIDTLSISVDPEWAFTMQLWQNKDDFYELTKTAVWISSSTPRRFYYLRRSSKSGEFFLKEYLFSFVYSNQILPTDSPRVLLCAFGENKIMFSGADSCEKKLDWLPWIRTGFTDKKWFRMFTSEKVYIFEKKAIQNIGRAFDIFELSFKEFFKCKKKPPAVITDHNHIIPASHSLAIPIVAIVFCCLLAATVLTWFFCIFCKSKKSKVSTLKKGDSNLVAKKGKIDSSKKKSSKKKRSKERKKSKKPKDSKERDVSSSANFTKESIKKSSCKGSSKKEVRKTKEDDQKRSTMTTVKAQLLSTNKKASVSTQKASQQPGKQQPSVQKAVFVGTQKALDGTKKASVGTGETSAQKASVQTVSLGTKKASVGTRKTSAQKSPARKVSLGTRKTSIGTRKASLGTRKTSARKASIGTRKAKNQKHSKRTLKAKSQKASTQTKVSKEKKVSQKRKRLSSRKTTNKTSKGHHVKSKQKRSLDRRASSKNLNERKTSKAKKTISRKGSMKSKKTANHSHRRKGTK